MNKEEYGELRRSIGSQVQVAKMLGIRRETLSGREKGRCPLCFEAQLAMKALAALPPAERVPATSKGEVRATALEVLLVRSQEAARAAKRKVRARLADLYGNPSMKLAAVRGAFFAQGERAVRWELWQRQRAEHRRLTLNVAVIARALRATMETNKK